MLLPSTILLLHDRRLVELHSKILKMDGLSEKEALELLKWTEETLAHTPFTDLTYQHFSKQFTDYQKYLVTSSVLGRVGFEKQAIGLVVSPGLQWGVSDISECAAVFGLKTFRHTEWRFDDSVIIDISDIDITSTEPALKELLQCFESSRCEVKGLVYLPAYRDSLVATPELQQLPRTPNG